VPILEMTSSLSVHSQEWCSYPCHNSRQELFVSSTTCYCFAS